MKAIYLKPINYIATFVQVKGSYYDYVAEVYSPSEVKHKELCMQLETDGWEYVATNTEVTVYVKGRHIIRIFRIWE